MPSGKEAPPGEARETTNNSGNVRVVPQGRKGVDGAADAETGGGQGAAAGGRLRQQQQQESAATTTTTTTSSTSTASAAAAQGEEAAPARQPATEAAVAAAATADAVVVDPDSSASGSNAAATNAGDVTTADPPRSAGDGDQHSSSSTPGVVADHQQHDPAAAASAARAMVRDDDEMAEDGQPKRVTLQNYASRDSGAVMLESSALSKGMPNLLLNSKDKYAITPCEQQQWAVLGLSEDILVKTIVVGSYEKYSSLLKEFQVCMYTGGAHLTQA